MQESEHHLRLEIAKVLDSRGTHVSREIARVSSRDIVHDGRFHPLVVNDEGEYAIAEPPPKKVLGKILLGLGSFAVLGAAGLLVADYINLKMAKAPAPVVIAAHSASAAPAVLGSTQPKTTALLAPLPAMDDTPPAAQPVATKKPTPPAAAVPTAGNRQIPLSHGFGEVKEDDGSTKFLIKPDGG